MSTLYFVSHSMHETPFPHGFVKSLKISWNRSNHHWRKFIKHSGTWIDPKNRNVKNCGSLFFWGEYEPNSVATFLSHRIPRAVHSKFQSIANLTKIPSNAHNTDPYVFEDRFRYICCKKPKPKVLKSGERKYPLQPNDIVLFGYREHDRFHFDTVFVCKQDGISVDTFEAQYYTAGALRDTVQYLDYAEGYMEYDKKDMFSFVPCKAKESSDSKVPDASFAFSKLNLPFIDLSKHCWTTKGRQVKKKPLSNNVELESIWKEILRAVDTANLKCGIQFDKI